MTSDDVCRILVEVLGIDTAKMQLRDDTKLLGSLPEFDSMAVVSVLITSGLAM